MLPSPLTLSSLKVGFKNMAFTPSTLSSVKPSWQMMCHGLKVKVFILKHRPSRRYLDMRQECRKFYRVASLPCDWLLSVLDRARGASLTKVYGKIDE